MYTNFLISESEMFLYHFFLHQNLLHILDAFKKARQRMVIARENATRELMKDSKHKNDLFSRTK